MRSVKLLEPESVLAFITSHPELVSLLMEVTAQAVVYFGSEVDFLLSVVPDYEGRAPAELFVEVLTGLPLAETIARLEHFDQDWWLEASRRGQSLVQVDALSGGDVGDLTGPDPGCPHC